MSWFGYIALFHLCTCCMLQKAPVFQGQVYYQELVNPLTDHELRRNCGPPPAIENAMRIFSHKQEFSSGSSVIYQCYRLYEMEGTPLAICSNGHWIGVPSCLETCRTEEAEMERNNIQIRWITKSTSMTASDYWVEFECRRGFRKDPSSPPFRKQCVTGPWVYPRCI